MYLVRVLLKGFNHWLDLPDAVLDQLRKGCLPLDDESISVFEASNDREEALAVSAHYVTLQRSYIDSNTFALRISASDLDGSGIRVELRPGSTGIAAADRMHRELCGSADQFTTVFSQVVRAARSGEDRVRRVGRAAIREFLIQFCTMRNDEVSVTARRLCEQALQG